MNKSLVGFKRSCVWVCGVLLWVLSFTGQSGAQTKNGFKRTYVDHIGRSVTLEGIPQRIISLAPSSTEIFFALGLEREVVGVTNYCDFPEAAKHKTKVGGLVNPNYEVIVSLKPDLAIATMGANLKEAVEKISGLGIPVYVLNARTVADTFQSIRDVGELTGKRHEAERLVENLNRRLKTIQARLKSASPKKVLFLVWYDPIIAPGKNSFINDALRMAGAESITADAKESYPRYSLEQIIIKKPDYIFMAKNGHKFSAKIEKEPGWQTVPAVMNRRIYFIDERIQHPSPRLVDAIEEVARILFPEAFK